MKYLVRLAVFVGVGFLAIALGVGLRFGIEAVSEAKNSENSSEVLSAKSENLCIANLNLTAELPESVYKISLAGDGLTLVSRSDEESFLIYEIQPGLDLEKHYGISGRPTINLPKLATVAYVFDDDPSQMSYLVASEPPFFAILLFGTPDDERAKKDLNNFLITAQIKNCES